MKTNTAEKLPAFDPVWKDLDDLFPDESVDLKDIFDTMVERQIEVGHDVKTPCAEAQELITQWGTENGGHDYTQYWREAVARWRGTAARQKPGISEVAKPKPLNDALVHGSDTPEWQVLLQREMTFLLPEKANGGIKQTVWNNKTVRLQDWLEGGAKGALTRHAVRSEKGYMPIVFGASAGNLRSNAAMTSAECLALDVESGDSRAAAEKRAEEMGLATITYTSFNDQTTTSLLKRDAVLQALKIETDPSDEQVRTYLTELGQHRPEHIATIRVKDQHIHTERGVMIELEHAPLEKWRMIFPLSEVQMITNLGPFQKVQQAVFASKIRGLARMMGVIHDGACEDVCHAFYAPSHRPGADCYVAVHRGRGLTFDEIPVVEGKRTSNGQGSKMKGWAKETASFFEIAALLEAECPDKVREDKGGLLVVECPFDHLHGNAGDVTDSACHVRDADGDTGFVWACKHNGCKDHDRLDMLAQALNDGWFERDLIDAGSPYVIQPDEEEPAAKKERARSFEARAADFDDTASQEEIEKFFTEMLKAGADVVVQANVTEVIVKKTNIGKRAVNALWKSVKEKARKKDKKADRPDGIFITEPAPDQTRYACDAIKSANEKDPFLFEYMEDAAIVRDGRILITDPAKKRHELGKVASFHRLKGEGETQHIYPPYDVVNDVFASDLSEFLLPIRGAVDTPFFAADGTLVTENGYHFGSEIFLQSELDLKRVSAVPTAEEVYEAKRLLIEEVLADFPLGALTRPEIVSQALHGGGVPAVTNMMALMLLPFMREMIDGPTPGHMLTKPAPGTGASFLVDVISNIATGQVTPALAMPARMEEMSKTLTSVLSNGQSIVLFDNINHSVDSGELASAMTAPIYQARILGKSQTIEVPVRCAWVFTGNNVTLTSELARRLLFIDLDARVANPEKRTGFRHEDIRGWSKENRGELVWACLTIIQNWVAKGMVKQREIILASYENWSGVVGGVLRDADMGGFLQGQEDEREKAADAAQDGVQQLMDIMSDYDDGTLFRPGGTAQFAGERTISIMDILNGVERANTDGDDGETIQINGWGYNSGDGTYNKPTPIKNAFEKLARKPHAGEDYTLQFEVIHDRKNSNLVFRMTKEVA